MRQADVRIAHGPAAGLRFSSGDAFPSRSLGTAEPEVQEALAAHLQQGDAVYDIGANVGFYTLLASRLVGPSGRVYAVEPQPQAIATLRHNLVLNGLENAEIVEAAVADESGEGELGVSQEGVLEWAALVGDDSPAVSRIRVSVTTIDEIATKAAPPALIKLDVEGAEIRALRGVARTLASDHPIVVCEANGTGIDVAELLTSAGYRVSTLEGGPIQAYGQILAVYPDGS
jgi:FkbM family methyltransferase